MTKRKIKIIIMFLISTLFALLISFSVLYIVHNRESKQNYFSAASFSFITEDGVYYEDCYEYIEKLESDLASGTITYEQVQNILNDLTSAVSNVKQQYLLDSRRAFMLWLNNESNGSSVDVKLLADIDIDEYGIYIENFKGTFDGNGHTILNVNYDLCYERTISAYLGDVQAWVYSFFLNLPETAVIKNLRIKNCGVYDSSVEGGFSDLYQFFGGLVGYSEGGTISNCIVENFSLRTKGDTSKIYACGIFAAGHATIENCLVKNVNIEKCEYSSFIGPANPDIVSFRWGLNDDYTHFFDVIPSSINGVVVKDFNTLATFNNIDPLYSVLTHYTTDFGYSSEYYKHTISAYYHPQTDENYNADKFNALKYDFGSLSKDNWYFPPTIEFNNGWPYPKKYHINFVTYSFQVLSADSSKGYIQEKGGGKTQKITVDVPSTITPIFSQAQTITFYGKEISAIPNSGYVFYTWSKANQYRYNALFNIENYKFIFDSVNGVAPKMYYKTSPNVLLDKISAGYTQTLYCTCIYSATETIIKYEIANLYVVEYHFSSMYCFKDAGLKDVVNSNKIKDLNYLETYHIKPTVVIKSYDVIVQ